MVKQLDEGPERPVQRRGRDMEQLLLGQFEILAELKRRRSASVSTVARAVSRSMQTVSSHLQHLEAVGIIERRRRGRIVTYRLSMALDPITRQIIRVL